MRLINLMFPNARSYATHQNAERALRRAIDKLGAADDDSFLAVVTAFDCPKHQCTRYQAIVIVTDRCRIPVGAFLHAGLCVTN